jgi:hypothetical protein
MSACVGEQAEESVPRRSLVDGAQHLDSFVEKTPIGQETGHLSGCRRVARMGCLPQEGQSALDVVGGDDIDPQFDGRGVLFFDQRVQNCACL